MIELVNNFNNYTKEIPQLIEKSDYKLDFFIRKLGISKPTMYRKLRENSFTLHEITEITKLLYPREAYKMELIKSIDKAKKDFDSDRTYTSKEMAKAMKEKIKNHQ